MSSFRSSILLIFAVALFLSACSAPAPPPDFDAIADLLDAAAPAPADGSALARMGYTIQVGAFSSLDNAVRLEGALERRGIDAFYFRHESGLYKVRFGNHGDYQGARAEAEGLQRQGLIGDFFIVVPEDYAVARLQRSGPGELREELVRTARRFLGVPYRWGGTSADKGFDCSGLTLVCYRLNGLDLPRVSYHQFAAGRYVTKSQLQKGDLVFFATTGRGKVSHVGMYIGGGNFIHAPRKGKTVRVASLSNAFFRRTYMGGRTYL